MKQLNSVLLDSETQFNEEHEYYFNNDSYKVSYITDRAKDPIIYFTAENEEEKILISLLK